MELTRRKFIVLSAIGLPGVLSAGQAAPAAGGPAGDAPPPGAPGVPWHQRIRRVGQVNFNERDPVELDVEAWADYWASLAVDAVLVSVTGILAFYRTRVPFHRRSMYLGGGDLFGACAAAAKRRGIRVIARLSPDLQWEDALAPHPGWFMRDAAGKFLAHGEEPRLFRTCMFSDYFTEHIPAIMREVQAGYDVDGLFTNAWPPLDGLPECHCELCRALAPARSAEYWRQFTDRTLELWRLYDSIAREKKPDNLFLANMGSGIRATPNLVRLAGVCRWFNCDNQGRGGDATPVWGAAQQGRVAAAVMKGRTVTNVTGAYATGGAYRWRNTSKSAAELGIWMDQTVASGMKIWYHWVGGQSGLGEDHRWQEIGRRYMKWHSRHEAHFTGTRTIASVGVVMGQASHLLYAPPGDGGMAEFVNGLYYALLEGRVLFDFVHEDDLGPATVGRYAALLLPNVAWLSDRQCGQLRDYAAAGGSIMASFETGMYDESGRRRAVPGLAGLFGIDSVGAVAAPNGNGFYARIERPHEILRGFGDTRLIPGGGYRLPVRAKGEPVLSALPAYTAYPPELSYSPDGRTDGPAVILREDGRSRLVYLSGDIERSYWRSGDTDLGLLLRNSVAWLMRGGQPVVVEGDGLVECFAWETGPGFALHVLNYTNPNLHRGWLRENYPIGPQRVSMQVPGDRRVRRVELLRAERDVPFSQAAGRVEFTIPGVVDCEIAALHA